MATEKEGYKDHRAGSNKGEVHREFDRKGRDAALKLGDKLGLGENTLRQWCSTWAKDGGGSKTSARRPAAKPAATKRVVSTKTGAAKKKAA